MAEFIEVDDLRTTFALSMSAMYKSEVPLYGDLTRIVQNINKDYVSKLNSSNFKESHFQPQPFETNTSRLDLERHGAIRVGTPGELQMIKRIFRLLGMYPVGYYDLSIAGLPMHATCFRPITTESLQRNPFRVFTTLLRPELIVSSGARDLATGLLERRNLFTEVLRELVGLVEDKQAGRVRESQVETFIKEALKVFGWQRTAAASHLQYDQLKTEHPVLADIACFKTVHINHLTPRTLDIERCQKDMFTAGMNVKSRIEGPPKRCCPILLRQTSFLALKEPVKFEDSGHGQAMEGSHTARFGEIEERGVALTRKGRQLYDELLTDALAAADSGDGSVPVEEIDQAMAVSFKRFPDSWEELFRQSLAFFEYECGQQYSRTQTTSLIQRKPPSKPLLGWLIAEGVISLTPITYEDFLPLSAAGIFQSNLQGARRTVESSKYVPLADRGGFEKALGDPLLEADDLYREIARKSLERTAAMLGVELDSRDLCA